MKYPITIPASEAENSSRKTSVLWQRPFKKLHFFDKQCYLLAEHDELYKAKHWNIT
jgi:hypothetical protein